MGCGAGPAGGLPRLTTRLEERGGRGGGAAGELAIDLSSDGVSRSRRRIGRTVPRGKKKMSHSTLTQKLILYLSLAADSAPGTPRRAEEG